MKDETKWSPCTSTSTETVSLPRDSLRLQRANDRACFALDRAGAIEDLARVGLTLADAVGRRFTFNGGGDGEDGDILCHRVVVFDPK